jgi:Concanavalin A-like lectin/glucanases superfamily
MTGGLMFTIGTFLKQAAALAFDFINPPQLVSASFNGSSQYLTIPASSNWALGTGDFTIEWWQYMTTQNSNPRVFSVGNYPSASIAVSIEGGTFYVWEASGFRFSYALTSYLNVWEHYAISRVSGTTSVYRNGTQIGSSYADTNNINDSSSTLVIGQESTTSSGSYFTGYLSNFRIIKGTGIYNGNFTPPTKPLTAVSNTVLLLSMGVTPFTDTTGINTITNNGSISTTASSPFPATWTDSINGIVATVQSTPTYDPAYGGGINFTEAVPTWVDVPTSSTGTTPFTISMAATVPQSAGHYVPLFDGNTTARAGNYIYSRKWTNFEAGTLASGIISIALDMGKLAWYDFVYNGTSITVYRNGRLLSSGTLSAANQGWLNPLRFGGDESTPGNTMATGALYRMKHQLTALSASDVSTQFETVRSSIGGGTLAGSLSFPGGVAGTRMLDLSTGFTLGAGSYTVEGWFQLPDFNNQYALFGANASAGDGNGMMNLIVGSSTSIFSDKNGGGGSVTYTVSTMSANTWYHFALTRNGTTEALFINGVRAGNSVTNAINYTAATTRIGMSYVRSWPGYMTNFRAVVGSYVYDPSYAYCTVPIGPLTNITNTKYLMLGAVATTDSSGTNTVTNTGSVTQSSSTKPF